MSTATLIKTYKDIPVSKKEILRYAGCRETADDVAALMEECIREASDVLTYKVCYREMPAECTDGVCRMGPLTFSSEKLARNLSGCSRAVVFAATVGVGLDRLITKYSRLSPAKAFMLQAYGAERIEALCDEFCRDMEREYGAALRPRFSPGYGDLLLQCQRDIFSVLGCEKNIGLTLNDSLLMSPTKSVTAVAGIE